MALHHTYASPSARKGRPLRFVIGSMTLKEHMAGSMTLKEHMACEGLHSLTW